MRTRAYYQKVTRMAKPYFRAYDVERKCTYGEKQDSLMDAGRYSLTNRDFHVLESWPAEKVHAWYGDDVK